MHAGMIVVCTRKVSYFLQPNVFLHTEVDQFTMAKPGFGNFHRKLLILQLARNNVIYIYILYKQFYSKLPYVRFWINKFIRLP